MWKCSKCENEFERLEICWGVCGGKKVDILDYFCPICGNTGGIGEPKIAFLGTKQEADNYWDMEWEQTN